MQTQILIPVSKDSDFTIHNIPFGVVFHKETKDTFCATIIGQTVLNLKKIEEDKLFQGPLFSTLDERVFNRPYLNPFMSLVRSYWKQARLTIQQLVQAGSKLKDNLKTYTCDIKDVQMRLPCQIGDYTDFYSSKNHALNVGSIIRGPDYGLQENWLHLPVAYHGRVSSIVVSGTPIIRPRGQTKIPTQKLPKFTETMGLDFQVQMGAFIGGKTNELGYPIKVNDAIDNIFGLVLLNDWTSRDIQGWEYVPLGPFTSKNSITTISPWIVTLQALQVFAIYLPQQDPTPLKYLQQEFHLSFDINLICHLKVGQECKQIVRTNLKYLYWSIAQQLTHHTVTGCNMKPGDLLGSGTISGQQKGSYGCLFQITQSGKQCIKFEKGQRRFLENGDKVMMRGYCEKQAIRIGFGECDGQVLPALNEQLYY